MVDAVLSVKMGVLRSWVEGVCWNIVIVTLLSVLLRLVLLTLAHDERD